MQIQVKNKTGGDRPILST